MLVFFKKPYKIPASVKGKIGKEEDRQVQGRVYPISCFLNVRTVLLKQHPTQVEKLVVSVHLMLL